VALEAGATAFLVDAGEMAPAVESGGMTTMGWEKGRRERAFWWVFFGLALGGGLFLRVYQLGAQIPLDDEWHAINKLLRSDAGDIATHFGLADYSIPLTLFYRFLYLHGGLSEWGMRLPMLLAGVGLLIVAPWFVRDITSLRVRAIWTGLLAIAPILVYHARTARPYAITTLLCLTAIFAFRLWRQRREARWRWAALYVAATFLAGYLHLIALTFALLPFAYFGIATLRDCAIAHSRARGLGDLRDLIVIAVATALPLAAALLPPLLNDWVSLAAKAGTDSPTLESSYRTLMICFGIGSPWLLVVFFTLCVLGARRLWRRDGDLGAYLTFVAVVSIAAIVLSKAAWLQHSPNLARYVQPLVPFALLFVAEGIASLLACIASDRLQALVASAALGGAYLAGPIPGYLYSPNQFMGHQYFQFDYDPAHNPYRIILPTGPIPDFYTRLGKRAPRSLTLIETPWSLETPSDPQQLYQAVHRQDIRIALTSPECGVSGYGNYAESATGMRLRNFTHISALLRGETGRADYLVVHLRSWPAEGALPSEWPNIAATCLPQIEEKFGAPAYRDDDIEVFALAPAARAAP
jgi:hypothetical protein